MKTNTPFTFCRLKLLSIMLAGFIICSQSYAQAPVNDLCGNAVPLTSGPSCSPVAGTVANATFTSGPSSACSGGTVKYDVWYTFTAQTTNPTIALSNVGAAFTAQTPRIQVFSGSCASLSSMGCVSGTSYTPTTLTVGTIYYIRIFSTTTLATPAALANFDICITDPAPANDLCANAITLTSAAACTPVTGTVISATYTAASGATACTGTDVYDVWYKFVAQTSNPTVSIGGAGAGFVNPQVQLLSGTCGSFTSVGCGAGSYTAAGLTVGTTYYVRAYSTTAPASSANGTFSICVTDPAPVNDLCSNAININSAATCINTTGNLTSSTNSTITGNGCNTSYNDVWYSFTAQTVNPTITLGTSVANARFQVLSAASCGGTATSYLCSGGTSGTLSGLTIGTTYLVRVFSTSNAKGVFNICITDPAPPNDLCAAAVTLTSAATCTNTAGNMVSATYTAASGATACTGTDVYDVWYKFVAQTVNPTITVSGAGTGFINPQIQLLSGTCGSFTSLGCAPNAYTASGLTVGTTYYVRIYSTTAPVATADGDFNICITDPVPPNDLCSNAISLTSATTCIATTGNLTSSTNTTITGNTCNAAFNDVWYSFTAQTTNPTITLSTSVANARFQVLSAASCGGTAASFFCSTGTSGTVTGLTIGTTYLVRVFSTTNAKGVFNICVTNPLPVNDGCAAAALLTSTTICTNTAGNMVGATYTAASGATACTGTDVSDVWYRFVAQTVNPTITVSSAGAGFIDPQIQLLSGTCGSFTSLGCAPDVYTASGLTVGTTYYVRVYSTSAPAATANGTFNICITDPVPLNDECFNAIAITSNATCVNTTGSLVSASFTAIANTCSAGTNPDVWYSFIAQTTNPTITVSTLSNARFQLYTAASCSGPAVSVYCSSGSSATQSGLTVGATYLVRVYSNTNAKGPLNICITDPAAPVNDNCAGAINLNSAASCSNTGGTLLNSTPTAGIPNDCGDPASPEVWYKFVANSVYPVVTLSSVGAQFTAAGPRLQLLSGSCGSFTSIGCVSGTTMNAFSVAGPGGLTIGNTYYIRVYTGTAGMAGANWGFNICITDPAAPTVDYGKSYVNITKGSGGGTIEPGDELEIRATVAVRGNTAFNPTFTGSIPANTTYMPNTLRLLTNEGKIYKQYTDAADGDPGTITGSTVNINLGTGATQTMGGIVKSTDRPLGGGTFMVVVSYHVIVGAVPFGSYVSVGGGNVSYASATGTVFNINFPAVTAVVYKNYGICTNTIGGNGILSENGGSFGSGNTKDRAPSGNVPTNYTYTPFTANAPGDYYYGLSNNTSGSTAAASYSIDPNDLNTAHRVFGVWDIIGDHTGAADPLIGNPPADVNSGKSGGYMVVINASYRTDTAFLDTVRNLCPNTSYEYSAWFRNMCRKCGVDSIGNGPTNAAYVPTGPGDTSGVHPNLTFNINGYDYYTTGDMGYTGQWVKKGFTYRTGPSETQMIINIRNNAPGGGGNDWAIDDIGVASCSPTLDVNPSSSTINVCYADGFSLSALVKSYFNNYTYFVWERSTDSGATFQPTPYSSNGTITPVYNGTDYEYTATGPSFIGDSTTHNNIYRLRVGSSASNLADTNCSFLATRTVKVKVNNCMWLLKADFVIVAGSLQNSYPAIQWTTVNETDKTSYELERSTDGIHFNRITIIKANGLNGNGSYQYIDPVALNGMGYYRIKLVDPTGFKYSKTILLSTSAYSFAIKNLVNPFSSAVQFDVIVPGAGDVRATIYDNYGRVVKIYTQQQASKGIATFDIPNVNNLSNGIYTLKVEWQHEMLTKRIIKMDR